MYGNKPFSSKGDELDNLIEIIRDNNKQRRKINRRLKRINAEIIATRQLFLTLNQEGNND